MLALIFSLWIGARPAELETLADRMRGLPPEFAADLLLRLAESPLIQERAWKRELIEDAFVFAAHAQWPYRRFGVRHTDSRPAREAWDNGLDSMALRTRAISDVLPLERARARAMFQEIGRLALPRAGCEDALVPRLSIYYETARKLLEESFAPGERKEEEDVRFLERILAAVESPAQVEAAARLLAAAQLAPAQREALAAVFAAAIGRIDGTDRIFEANDWFVVETVAAAGGANGTAVLVPALRSYLVRHLTAPRCANRVDVGDRRQPAREFNALVQKLNGAGADSSSSRTTR